ncbi:UPF0160 protein [Cucumispora dikerogammari]|nr:UPF0160 protein [Cucumispora dikerogammari]
MFLITHDGVFSSSEITTTAILTLINDKCILLRTQDLKTIQLLADLKIHESEHHLFFKKYSELLSSNSSIVVFDVIGVHDPPKNIFDQDQQESTESFYDNNFKSVKMSSTGMVFKKHNKQLIKRIMEECKIFKSMNINKFIESKRYKDLIECIYDNYFLGIDAFNNVVNETEITLVKQWTWSRTLAAYNTYQHFGAPSKYNIEDISIDFLEYVNPDCDYLVQEKRENISFKRAVEVVRQNLELYLRQHIYTFTIAYEIVLKKISIAEQYKEGQIVYWKQLDDVKNVDLDFDLDVDVTFIKKMQIEHFPKAKFFIYQPKGTAKMFRIYGAAVNLVTNKSKAYLKKEWRGLRGEPLIRISSMKRISFVHASGFTGGAFNFQTSLDMCVQSL